MSKANSQKIEGRSIFIIETTAAGVKVQTGFLANDGQIHAMPAVFPTLQYALQQIDELKAHVINHFTEAASVGVQVIASQQNSAEAAESKEAGKLH